MDDELITDLRGIRARQHERKQERYDMERGLLPKRRLKDPPTIREIDALLAFIDEYANHCPECAMTDPDPLRRARDGCTCGLTAALAAINEGRE